MSNPFVVSKGYGIYHLAVVFKEEDNQAELYTTIQKIESYLGGNNVELENKYVYLGNFGGLYQQFFELKGTSEAVTKAAAFILNTFAAIKHVAIEQRGYGWRLTRKPVVASHDMSDPREDIV